MKLNKTITICLNIFLGIILLIGLIMGFSMLPIKGNFQILSVMSGSMEPAIDTGELIIVKPDRAYNVGDIISFKPNDPNKKESSITHRIVEKSAEGGEDSYITRGDANDAPDANVVRSKQVIGRLIFGIKYVGYLTGYIKTLPGLIIIIVIPATVIIYEEVNKIKNEARAIISKRKSNKLKNNDRRGNRATKDKKNN